MGKLRARVRTHAVGVHGSVAGGWQSPGWVVRRIMIAARMFHAMKHIPRRREIGKCRNDATTIPQNATALSGTPKVNQQSTKTRAQPHGCTLNSSLFTDYCPQLIAEATVYLATIIIGTPNACSIRAIVLHVKLCPPPSHLVTSDGRLRVSAANSFLLIPFSFITASMRSAMPSVMTSVAQSRAGMLS